MRKFILAFCFCVLSVTAFAQSNFDKTIKSNAAKLEKATTVEQFDAVFSEFAALVHSKDSNRWQAYYYAGLTQYKKAEILMKSGNTMAAADANANAYKYVAGGVPAENTDGKKLLDLISKQKSQLQ